MLILLKANQEYKVFLNHGGIDNGTNGDILQAGSTGSQGIIAFFFKYQSGVENNLDVTFKPNISGTAAIFREEYKRTFNLSNISQQTIPVSFFTVEYKNSSNSWTTISGPLTAKDGITVGGNDKNGVIELKASSSQLLLKFSKQFEFKIIIKASQEKAFGQVTRLSLYGPVENFLAKILSTLNFVA